MKWSGFIPIAGLALMAALPLWAADPLTPEKKQEQERFLSATAKDLNDSCQAKIAVSIDWKSFEGADLSGHSPWGFCKEPIETLTSICDNSETKKARVQEKIKTVSCVYAGKATPSEQTKEPPIKEVTVRNGTLVWKFNWNADNVNDYMIDFFRKFF